MVSLIARNAWREEIYELHVSISASGKTFTNNPGSLDSPKRKVFFVLSFLLASSYESK